METLYSRLSSFEGNNMDFEDQLSDLNLTFFDNLYAVYPQKDRARKAVMYILYAYSKDSVFILANENWSTTKQRAAKKAGLDEEMINELVKFEFKFVAKEKKDKDAEEIDDGTGELEANEYNVTKIVKAINDFLDYQSDKINKHLRRMNDLYEQLSSASVAMITKGKSGAIDWEQKANCQKEASRLFKEIEEWEQKLLNESNLLKPAIDEITDRKKIVKTLRPEVV